VTQVACIGECMIELREMADGHFSRGYGGDTLNTAVYLARLGVDVDYVTALGDDPWSDEMVAGWAAEGVGTRNVARIAGRLPGLYIIQTDARGERRFSYWRDNAPARELFDHHKTAAIVNEIPKYDLLYFSGITLSLYGEVGRQRFFETLKHARAKGRRIAFDTNFRPRGWPDLVRAKEAYRAAFEGVDIVLASTEDLDLLFSCDGVRELLFHRAAAELVLKMTTPVCRIIAGGVDEQVGAEPVPDVVDTTAAGDSFAAAYLAARLAGAEPREAARAGHRLAGAVVRHPGAIIPRASMPDGFASPSRQPRKELQT
jgi:2-dehydro-3-deoxygluconokinase